MGFTYRYVAYRKIEQPHRNEKCLVLLKEEGETDARTFVTGTPSTCVRTFRLHLFFSIEKSIKSCRKGNILQLWWVRV
ncbi:hypothetical protein OUZ56_015728 [Daphnia magna]|uniref:Uncharacterized protein n=1 Tax=Daphnia magna TaxID=35525 RepID=A0ABR0ANK4_9CRUS|nr:hypothetical protein OUZ56_015728 [Daphnia magna]